MPQSLAEEAAARLDALRVAAEETRAQAVFRLAAAFERIATVLEARLSGGDTHQEQPR